MKKQKTKDEQAAAKVAADAYKAADWIYVIPRKGRARMVKRAVYEARKTAQ